MRFPAAALALALIAGNALAQEKAPPSLVWIEGDFAKAQARAKETSRILFVFVTRASNVNARRMVQDTFHAESLVGPFNRDCVNLRIDIDGAKELATKLQVTAAPAVLFLDEDGNRLLALRGYQSAPALLKALKAAQAARAAAPAPGSGTPGGGSPAPGAGTGNDPPDSPEVEDLGEPTLPGDLLFKRVLPGIRIESFAPGGTIVRFLPRMGSNFDRSAGAPPPDVKVVYVTDSEETKIPEWAERAVVPQEYYPRLMTRLRRGAVHTDSEFSFVFDSDRRQIAKCVGLKHRLKDLYAFCRAVSDGYLSLDRPEPGAAVARVDKEDPFTNWIDGLNVWPNGKTEEGVGTLTRGQVFLLEVSGGITLSDAPGHTLCADGGYVTASTGRFAVPGQMANSRFLVLRVDSGLFAPEEDTVAGIYHALMPGHGIKLKAQISRRAAEGTRTQACLRVDVRALQDADLSEPEIFPEKPDGAKLVQMFDVWANSDKKVSSDKLRAGKRYIVEVTGTIELAPAVSSLKVHADAAFILDVGDRRSKFWKKEPARESTLFVDGNPFSPREDPNGASSYSWRVNGGDKPLVFSVHDPHDDDLANNAGAVTVTIWEAGDGSW